MDAVKDPTTGRLYKQEISLCGKERCKKCERGDGHGPYWYAYWWEGGKTRKKYIGKTLPASLTQDNLQKTEVLTQDSEESYVRPLPKTDTLHKTTGLTQDKALPKTAGKGALPKTDEGVVERALEVIRDFHSRGVEPSVSQVAEVVGGHPKHLGRWLKAEGLEAQNVRRGGTRARRYTFELKEKLKSGREK
jgi:hypothetical protein